MNFLPGDRSCFPQAPLARPHSRPVPGGRPGSALALAAWRGQGTGTMRRAVVLLVLAVLLAAAGGVLAAYGGSEDATAPETTSTNRDHLVVGRRRPAGLVRGAHGAAPAVRRAGEPGGERVSRGGDRRLLRPLRHRHGRRRGGLRAREPETARPHPRLSRCASRDRVHERRARRQRLSRRPRAADLVLDLSHVPAAGRRASRCRRPVLRAAASGMGANVPLRAGTVRAGLQAAGPVLPGRRLRGGSIADGDGAPRLGPAARTEPPASPLRRAVPAHYGRRRHS